MHYFAVMASADGFSFSGWQTFGRQRRWQKASLICPLRGDDSVWVAFRFTSDYAPAMKAPTWTTSPSANSPAWGEKTRGLCRRTITRTCARTGDCSTPPGCGTWRTSGEHLLEPSTRAAGDIPVMGDYDGDGDMNIALFGLPRGFWYARDWWSASTCPAFLTLRQVPATFPCRDLRRDGPHRHRSLPPSREFWYAKSYATGSWQNIAGVSLLLPAKRATFRCRPLTASRGETDIGCGAVLRQLVMSENISGGAWSNVTGFPVTYGVPGPAGAGDYDGTAWPTSASSGRRGKWYANGGFSDVGNAIFWRAMGAVGDIPVPLDYDGDGLPSWRCGAPSTRLGGGEPDLTVLVDDYRFGVSTDKPLGYNSGVSFLFFERLLGARKMMKHILQPSVMLITVFFVSHAAWTPREG